jgi:hypothetical protein
LALMLGCLKQNSFASKVSSACESRRKRKAWGVSPRCLRLKYAACDNGRQLSNSFTFRPHSRALKFKPHLPGAHAPGFTLSPASQVKKRSLYEIGFQIRPLRQSQAEPLDEQTSKARGDYRNIFMISECNSTTSGDCCKARK